MSTASTTTMRSVNQAITNVDDPEYPGLSIVDLGLVESCEVNDDGSVAVDLVPTFTGCPALEMIADDVREAVSNVKGVTDVSVNWRLSPTWTTNRISERGKAFLADRFTVAVQIGTAPTRCPRCGEALTNGSMFGPSRCRSVSRCQRCTETVEVMRA